MVIYRCDRCQEDFDEKADLIRVSLQAEYYDDSKGVQCYNSHEIYRTGMFEVCKNCAAILKATYLKCMEENN